MNLTAQPATDPINIYRYRDGLYAVDLVTAALVHFDFFSWLASHPSTLEQVCSHFDFKARPADTMLTLFAANGFIAAGADGVFHCTETAKEHLIKSSVWNLSPYFASLHDRPIARDFVEVLRTGKPAGWSGDKAAFDWHRAMEQEDFARNFTAMDCRGLYLSQELAKKLDLAGRSKVLDIGGGSGIYACAIVAHHAHMQGVVLDQAPVDRICGKLIEERGCAGRVEVVAANMFDGLPSGCDVHLFSNVLHDWDVPEALALLKRSYESLPTGGLLVIHDAFINAAKNGPLHVAEYSALLMHSTQGKCYSTGEYAAMAAEAGFMPGAYQDTVAARGFMTAIKS